MRTGEQNDLSPVLFLCVFFYYEKKQNPQSQLPTQFLQKVWACFPSSLCSQGCIQDVLLTAGPVCLLVLCILPVQYLTHA